MIELFTSPNAINELRRRVQQLAKPRGQKVMYDFLAHGDGQRILVEGKWRQLREGVDFMHKPHKRLGERQLRRRERHGVGEWPPLIAWNQRFITCLHVNVRYVGLDGVTVQFDWHEDSPPARNEKRIQDFWRYHVTGTRTMPARNPTGVDIDTLREIRNALDFQVVRPDAR